MYSKEQQVADWRERQERAERRVSENRYGYCDPQLEEDGLSSASIDDELGIQERELERERLNSCS
jgi:hypothetical protein